MNTKKTTNYKMFSILPMNREIRSEHVEKLVKSIRTMGIIRPVIICKTDVLEGEMKNNKMEKNKNGFGSLEL